MSQKNQNVCPVCGFSFSLEDESCPNCGTWMGKDEPNSVKSNKPVTSETDESKLVIPSETSEEYPDLNKTGEQQDSDEYSATLGEIIEMDDKVSCPRCGSFHTEKAKFCPETGEIIREDISVLATTPAMKTHATTLVGQTVRKRKLQLIGLLIIFLLLFGITIIGSRIFENFELSQINTSQSSASVYKDLTVSTQRSTPAISNTSVAIVFPSESPTIDVIETPTHTLTLTPSATKTPNREPVGQIVFTCYIDEVDNICSMNADGSNQQRLTHAGATDFYASWSPNGRLIVFSSRRDNSFQLYTMTADGENETRLSHDLGTDGLFSPAYSPRGDYIVFTRAENGVQNIWLMNADGSNPQQLTNASGDNVDPVWSPDENRIAFSSNRSGEREIYILDLNEENERHLETGVSDLGGRIDWSPDGRWIAFYAGPSGSRDIYMISVGGDKLRQLTSSGDNLAPSYSPDGNWIVYTSRQDGDLEVFIVRRDGSEIRQLTHNSRPDWQPRWGH